MIWYFKLEELNSRMMCSLASIMYQCLTTTIAAGPLGSPRILGHGWFDRTHPSFDRFGRRPIWYPRTRLKKRNVEKNFRKTEK